MELKRMLAAAIVGVAVLGAVAPAHADTAGTCVTQFYPAIAGDARGKAVEAVRIERPDLIGRSLQSIVCEPNRSGMDQCTATSLTMEPNNETVLACSGVDDGVPIAL